MTLSFVCHAVSVCSGATLRASPFVTKCQILSTVQVPRWYGRAVQAAQVRGGQGAQFLCMVGWTVAVPCGITFGDREGPMDSQLYGPCNYCGGTAAHTEDCPSAVAERQEARARRKVRDAARALAIAKFEAALRCLGGAITITENVALKAACASAVDAVIDAAIEATQK